jgi:hypothetical protein
MHGPTCIFWANPTPFSLQAKQMLSGGAAAFVANGARRQDIALGHLGSHCIMLVPNGLWTKGHIRRKLVAPIAPPHGGPASDPRGVLRAGRTERSDDEEERRGAAKPSRSRARPALAAAEKPKASHQARRRRRCRSAPPLAVPHRDHPMQIRARRGVMAVPTSSATRWTRIW